MGDALLARSCSCGWRATCLPTASCGRCATGGSVRACESKITARATIGVRRCCEGVGRERGVPASEGVVTPDW